MCREQMVDKPMHAFILGKKRLAEVFKENMIT